VDLTAAVAPRQLGVVDPLQGREELSRPLGLLADRTAHQRAQQTDPQPDTVRPLPRRVHQPGGEGWCPRRSR
jgi:hypothetical protein